MEKITKEELMDKLNLTEEELDRVAAGQINKDCYLNCLAAGCDNRECQERCTH